MAEVTDGNLRLVVTPSVSGTAVSWFVEVYSVAFGWSDAQWVDYSGAAGSGRHSYTASAPSGSSARLTSFTVSANGARGQTLTASFTVGGAFNGDAPQLLNVAATIPALVPATPNAPSVSSMTASGCALTAVAPSDNGSAITTYEYGWSVDGTTWTTSTSASLTFNVTGLAANTAHQFRVRALNGVGWSALSATASGTTLPTVPASPSGATVTRGSDTSHTVAWTRNATTGAPYATLEVQRWDNVTDTWVTIATPAGTATSVTDTSTVANRRYQYRVRATNSAGSSTWSTSSAIDTTPSTPTDITAVKAGVNIQVAWTNAASYACAVEVWHQPGSGGWELLATLAAGSAAAYTHTAPSAAVTHTYRVRAVSASPALQSGWATSSAVQLAAPPNAPATTLPAENQDAATVIPLAWQHNPVDSSAQSKYQYQWRLAGATTWTTSAEVTATAQQVAIIAGTFPQESSIEWQVRTWGQHATASPWSATAVFETSATPLATITSPASPHDEPRLTPTVGYFQASSVAQAGWELQLRNSAGATVETLAGSGSIPTLSTVVGDGTTWLLRARVRSAKGLWSAWVELALAIDYPEPSVPIVSATWSRETGTMEVSVENPTPVGDELAGVRNDIHRRIDGGAWVLIAQGVPAQGTFIDTIPTVAGRNEYRAQAWSELNTAATSEAVSVEVAEPGLCYVNFGAGFAAMVCAWANVQITGGVEREKALHRFAGRKRRVAFFAEHVDEQLTLNGRITPDASTIDQWRYAAAEASVVCVRSPKGHRLFGALGKLAYNEDGVLGPTLSIPVEDLGFSEGAVLS